jgi:NAD(P)-dependent dehydrogenase (short-subunit alcohol dehydrogenase family)
MPTIPTTAATLTFDAGAVIVVGGSGGIGEGIARRFAGAGMHVIITYYSNEAKAISVKSEIEAAGGRCDCRRVDVARDTEVEDLFAAAKQEHERIGHVIYAAGPSVDFAFIGAIPDEQWRHVIDSDLNGAFYLIQNAVKAFRAQGGGNLVAVITAAVERVPVKDALSAAPKAAIEMLVRGVAKEAGRFGIRANCVGPGWINAGLGKKGLEEKLDEKTREATRRQIPLQRFGAADDIAWAALFLCSREANFITGQSLAVDGGLQL